MKGETNCVSSQMRDLCWSCQGWEIQEEQGVGVRVSVPWRGVLVSVHISPGGEDWGTSGWGRWWEDTGPDRTSRLFAGTLGLLEERLNAKLVTPLYI